MKLRKQLRARAASLPCLPSLLATGGLLVAAGASYGVNIPITNPSFETPAVTGTTVTFTVSGWGQGTDTGEHQGAQLRAPPAQDGSQIAFLGNGTALTNLFQDITGAGQANTTS